jgi:hypothetical protein
LFCFLPAEALAKAGAKVARRSLVRRRAFNCFRPLKF